LFTINYSETEESN